MGRPSLRSLILDLQKEVKHMADVLQPIVDEIPVLVAAVDAAVAKIADLATKIANTADPAEVASLKAQIQAEVDALNTAVNPPAPTA